MHNSSLRTIVLSLFASLLFIFQINAQQLAFPGAEGFGRFASGGRGGSVYHVTNLNDAGAGSFRDAVSKPNRIVVFDVGGVIHISTRIIINKNITIAGQTAPGDGITIYGNGIALNSSSGNSIIRHIRIRMGVNGDSGKDAIGISDGQNYIFDHVSVSWGRDGTIDINGSAIDNISIQDCIIAQGLHSHSTGGLMQSGKASVIRTLYIDNHTRNPKGRGTQEYINNVIYNWRVAGYILGDTQGLSEANILGNYFIKGPSTSSGPFNRATAAFHAYVSENWCDNNLDGILNGSNVPDSIYGPVTFESLPFDYPGVGAILTPVEAYDHIVANAGASLSRDAVDQFLIQELTSLGTSGNIISNENENGISGNVGTVNGGTAPIDFDGDGMPDEWEMYYGFNPEDQSDGNKDTDGDGYLNIEEYINSTNPRVGLISILEGNYFIEASHSKKVIDILGVNSGDSLVQQEMLKKKNQIWQIAESDSAGYFVLSNKATGLAISLDSNQLVQKSYTGSDDQLWEILYQHYGLFSITNKHSGLTTTVNDSSLLDEAHICQDTFSSSPNQLFTFISEETLFKPPVITITQPISNTAYQFGDAIYIEAEATDEDGTIKNVSFFDGTQKIAEDSIPPYRTYLNNATIGSHSISIVAVDNDSLITESPANKILVVGSGNKALFIQENDFGFCSIDGSIDFDNGGYSGSGFSNTDNAIAKGINWKVNVFEAGDYTISFRYANGSTSRPGKLMINGEDKVAGIAMDGTGGWAIWKTTSAKVPLESGIQEIRLESTTSGGLGNVDYIEIAGNSVLASSCGTDSDMGAMTLEKFNNINGESIIDLLNCKCFPYSASEKIKLQSLTVPFNLDDNYGSRIRGFIKPVNTGNYTFWVSGSNACEFWLNSTDTSSTNAHKIAYTYKPSGIQVWDEYPSQVSAKIALQAGKLYYFDVIHKASVGDDYLEVMWEGPGFSKKTMGPELIYPWKKANAIEVEDTSTSPIDTIFTPIDTTGNPIDTTATLLSPPTQSELAIYPNPATEIITIEIPEGELNESIVSIYNYQGKLINRISSERTIFKKDITGLPPGIYLITVQNGNKRYCTRFIKQEGQTLF